MAISEPVTQSDIRYADNDSYDTNSHERRILVVDDNDLFLETITEALNDQKHHVTGVNNGWDACKQIFKDDFDMIILDVNMPVMDGICLNGRTVM